MNFRSKDIFFFSQYWFVVLLRTRLQNVRRAPCSDVSDSEVKTDKYEYILLFHFYQPVPLWSTCMEEGGELEPLRDSLELHTCLRKRRSKTALFCIFLRDPTGHWEGYPVLFRAMNQQTTAACTLHLSACLSVCVLRWPQLTAVCF